MPRDQARKRGVHLRHPECAAARARQPRSRRRRPRRHARPARRYPRRQGFPQVQDRADPGGETPHRHLRPGQRGRQERIAGGPRRRRGHRHPHREVHPQGHRLQRPAGRGRRPQEAGGQDRAPDGRALPRFHDRRRQARRRQNPPRRHRPGPRPPHARHRPRSPPVRGAVRPGRGRLPQRLRPRARPQDGRAN